MRGNELRRTPGLLAAGVFIIALAVYLSTLAPGLLWGGGDFATFQTKAYTRQIESNIFGHALWVILAQPFVALPIGDVAYRANFTSAFFAAAALAFVFLSAWRITRHAGASLLAAGALLVSHTFWTYAVLPKPYSLNALLLAACFFFLLRWGQDRRGRDLYIFAALYGISPLNHLVMFTAAAGFLAYVVTTARRNAVARREIIIASIIYVLALLPYAVLVLGTGEAESTGGSIGGFLRGFFTSLTSPASLALGLAAGVGLLLYQFPATVLLGAIGVRQAWRQDRPVAAMLLLIVVGNLAFLLGATDPRTGGEYVWNLHYYLIAYVMFALWLAIGFARVWTHLTRTASRRVASVALSLILPVAIYVLAPTLARPFADNLPGFRELSGRDNLTYVLSPWKLNETGARTLGESILATLPPDSVFFADYSIWSIVNYMQIVEGARPDVTLLRMPSVGTHQQLALIAAHDDGSDLFLADANRYYELDDIQKQYEIVLSVRFIN